MKVHARVETKKGRIFDMLLPGKRIVCPQCNGTGTELRGGLKGAVFSIDDFIEDPEFAERYFGGQYDVTCGGCGGNRVVDVVDVDALTPKMAERYWRLIDREVRDENARRAELRHMGQL